MKKKTLCLVFGVAAILLGILAFDRKKIEANIEMGYKDAMRKFSVGRE